MSRLNLLPVRLTTFGSFLGGANILEPEQFILIPLVVNAGIVLTVSPVIFLYFCVQRFFLEGIERSGIVG